MSFLQIAIWACIGLIFAAVEAFATHDDRAPDVYTVGTGAALLGGALGYRMSPPDANGFSLGALVTAMAISLAALLLFDLVRKTSTRAH